MTSFRTGALEPSTKCKATMCRTTCSSARPWMLFCCKSLEAALLSSPRGCPPFCLCCESTLLRLRPRCIRPRNTLSDVVRPRPDACWSCWTTRMCDQLSNGESCSIGPIGRRSHREPARLCCCPPFRQILSRRCPRQKRRGLVSRNLWRVYAGLERPIVSIADAAKGVLCHELVHTLQHDAKGQCNGGLIEGIADFVRLKAGLAADHWSENAVGDKWDCGYE
jgi:hypothetical protein